MCKKCVNISNISGKNLVKNCVKKLQIWWVKTNIFQKVGKSLDFSTFLPQYFKQLFFTHFNLLISIFYTFTHRLLLLSKL